MKTTIPLTVISLIIFIATSSCIKNDNLQPVATPPVMTEISISGENLVYKITVFFSEGVYANRNKAGDLSVTSFSLLIDYGDIIIKNYSVTHSACQKNANIRIVLNKIPVGDEVISIQPATCLSIYNFDGIAMCASDKLSITIAGT